MVHDPKNLTPEEQVDAAKQRLRQAAQRMGQDLGQTTDDLQAKVVETVQGVRGELDRTVDHLQERFEQTLSGACEQISEGATELQEQAQQFGNQIGNALKQPFEGIRKHPWEAVAGAVIVGFVVGELSSAGSTRRHPDDPVPLHRTSSDKERVGNSDGAGHARRGSVYASAAAGLGQTVWEVLRQDYLNPRQIRHWLHGLLGQPRPPEQEGS